jgi:predicted aminopeptidase
MRASARSVKGLLGDSGVSGKTRDFLALAEDIKAFGVEHAGLSRGKNFSTYIALERDYVALVIQAAPALSLEPWTWRYPFVGRLPYKGFFRRDDAEAEVKRLEAKNLDVVLRRVDAFSTLGFFTDPLYSFMEDYSEYELARLILHEETHARVFVKNHADFNEEFASFVGDTAALLYIEDRYGREAAGETAERRIAAAGDAETFRKDMSALADLLREVYSSPLLSEDEKLGRKKSVIESFKTRFAQSYSTRYKTKNYESLPERGVNNGFISLYLLYGEHRNRFAELYESYGGDLAAFVSDVAGAVKKAKDPWAALEKLRMQGQAEKK